MHLNLPQYRLTMRVFNNRQIIIISHYEASLYSRISNNLCNYCCSYSLYIFHFFFCVLFPSKGNVLKITTKLCLRIFMFRNIVPRILVCFCSFLLMLNGDVEANEGSLSNCTGICYRNPIIISVHDYSKSFHLKHN